MCAPMSHRNQRLTSLCIPANQLINIYKMYTVARPILLALIWIFSLIQISLTSDRIHHTRRHGGFYEPIVAALLATAIFSWLWVPYALVTNLALNGLSNRSVGLGLLHEGSAVIPWIMWLVCTAIFTNDIPAKRFCGFRGQCTILVDIQAFGWIAFSLLTFYLVMLLMHAAGHGLIGGDRGERAATPARRPGGVDGDKPVGAGPGVADRGVADRV